MGSRKGRTRFRPNSGFRGLSIDSMTNNSILDLQKYLLKRNKIISYF